MNETQVQSLILEDALENEMATHSSVLAWEIPWTEKPDGLQSVGMKESQIRQWLNSNKCIAPYSVTAMTYKRKEWMCVCACTAETHMGFPGGSVGRRAHLPRQETQETEVRVLVSGGSPGEGTGNHPRNQHNTVSQSFSKKNLKHISILDQSFPYITVTEELSTQLRETLRKFFSFNKKLSVSIAIVITHSTAGN